MFNPLKTRNRTFVITLLALMSFALILSAQGVFACGNKGCSKTCAAKSSGHTCPMMLKAAAGKETKQDESNVGQALDLKAFSTVEQYTCPMHPEIRSEKSGKCPECGMKLTKGDFYEVYACAKKECPHPCVSPKAGKCCGKELQKTMMSKDEIYLSAQLQDEYFCPMHSEVVSDKAGKCTKCGMKLEMRTVHNAESEQSQMLTYVCPMHPKELSDTPGDCAKCGMKLKQKEAAVEEGNSKM
jgi:hypothetical protein